MKSLIKFSFKAIFTVAALLLLAYFGWKYAVPKLNEKQGREGELYTVTRVFDGDTFEVLIKGKKEKVRMLGIDTPEKYDSDKLSRDIQRSGKDKKTIQKLGELSSDFTTRLIGGKKVQLVTLSGDDDNDKYERLLRYVYLEDGTFVNKKIVQEGYAIAFRRYEVVKLKELIEAENDARKENRGLWGDIEGADYMKITGN